MISADLINSKSFQDQKRVTSLSPSKSAAGVTKSHSRKQRRGRRGTDWKVLHTLGPHYSESPDVFASMKSPAPGQYDNFKTCFDRSKLRSCTIGRKFKPTA